MQSHYEINVAVESFRGADGSRKYTHLFATAPRSCTTMAEAARVAAEIRAKFPAPDYEVTVTHWQCVGRTI